MKAEEAKTATKALNELNESYAELFGALKATALDAEASKKLWREGTSRDS